MFEKLSSVLKKTTDRIANAMFLDKDLVDSIVRDLQRALIEADVNVVLVKDLSEKIKKVAFDERLKGVEKKEHLIKFLHDEIKSLLGGEQKTLTLKAKEQNRIMLLGLYGAGKTTTISKLGNYFAKRGKRVALVGLDVHRPAATDQLEQLGKQNNLTVFTDKKEKNAVKIYKEFQEKLEKFDLVLIDTAGRDALSDDLIKELKEISQIAKPTESILVMPADIGQAAKRQAEEFQKSAHITGVIITRMDSTAKAGGALTACAETKAPVYFIGVGEKVNDLESFDPESFISRLLGMGDLKSLIEKVQSVTDEGKQKAMQEKISKGELSMDDLVDQLDSLNQIGSFSKIKEMIPGFSNAKISDEQLETQQDKIKRWKFAIQSMTPEEKQNPAIIQKETSRIQRIANGAGITTSEVRALLKQYDVLKEFMKMGQGADLNSAPENMFSQKQMMKMAKKLGRKGMKGLMK